VKLRTVIERDHTGNVNLVVDGTDTSPEATVREYIKARDLLFPPVEEKSEEAKPKPQVKKKEVTE
jgi:hypothetical protein